LVSDLLLLLATPFLLYALRFEGWTWAPEHLRTALVFTLLAVPTQIAVLDGQATFRRFDDLDCHSRHLAKTRSERLVASNNSVERT
jgi:hypothetical protein